MGCEPGCIAPNRLARSLAGRVRQPRVIALLMLVVGACSSGPAPCIDAAPTREARAALDSLAARIDFVPVLPCGFGEGLVVATVVIDALPGATPQLRVSFIVKHSTGGRAYVFSQTRALITSSQIPQSTHRVRVSSGATTAEGFSGATGSGGESTYLRWRINEVTYELDATLGRLLTEAEVRDIAAALMARSAAVPLSASATPSGS